MDQDELETVVPQPGGSVLVLNGPYRGSRGTLLSIDTKRFQASCKGKGGLPAGEEGDPGGGSLEAR